MDTYKVIGLMSGTSLDGLDVAFCKFFNKDGQWTFEICNSKTYEYAIDLKRKLTMAHTLSAEALMQLDAELANLFAQHILSFINQYNIQPDFISSHGHTIFHQPLKSKNEFKQADKKDSLVVSTLNLKPETRNPKPFTTQIASGAIIAALTGIAVISDYRTADVALGGQGAPLVPIGDKLLFNQYDYCLNLGGIANISFDVNSAQKTSETRIASDICYANMPLNFLAGQAGFDFDKDGAMAAKGIVDEQLFKSLNNLDFHLQPFPKSTGKEYFENYIKPLLNNSKISIENKLRTFCEHIVFQIKNNLNATASESKNKKILVSGGGTNNIFLIELLKQNIPVEVVIPDKEIIDFKEALVFAFLGVLRFRGEVNVLSSVTGAKRNSCSGAINIG